MSNQRIDTTETASNLRLIRGQGRRAHARADLTLALLVELRDVNESLRRVAVIAERLAKLAGDAT